MRPVVLAAAAVALVAGCTGPDTAAVPTSAAAPYICDGVPREGVELTLGGSADADVVGTWQDDRFTCQSSRSSSKTSWVLVKHVPTSEYFDTSTDDPATQESEAGHQMDSGNGSAIEASYPGVGYVDPQDGHPVAVWTCGADTLVVELDGVDTQGRNGASDAQDLLVSMLPWACGGKDAPLATA